MADPGICVLCLAETCASEVHQVVNPVPPYGYLFPNMYLFIADITNRGLFVFMKSSASHAADPHGRLAQKR